MRPNKEKGFMVFKREVPPYRPIEERVKHWDEFTLEPPVEKTREQGYRCMNCGVPFCMSGCPLGNVIPDFNDNVKDDYWQKALDTLLSTNNFPEFTGRVCPAPCEASCCLGVIEPPVTIKLIEREIADRGWKEGWIKPEPAAKPTGKRVAVVGSGPAGLAAAQQLCRAGHAVTLFERDEEPGGLLMFGIPDFKLNKLLVRRRVEQMKAEGVEFRCGAAVGKDINADELAKEYDAVLLTIGSTKGRDLDIPGRDLDGIHFAMQFLGQQNRRVAGTAIDGNEILATGKNVVILGGGDTGSDCHGTSIRQGAKNVYSLELLPKPPVSREDGGQPWPLWPMTLTTSSSHEEGGQRDWSIMTKSFSGENGKVTKLNAVRLEWSEPDANGRRTMQEMPGSEFSIDCDLVLLALGFVHPEHDIPTQLGLELDPRGNIKADAQYRTSRPSVYAAGDARRGQSLVVWAIHEGREAARCVDVDLMGYSDLPSATSFGYDTAKVEGVTA
ncbi:MAG: glutamate synthase subunit beta [FCB group bacterium]|jgi:glutamate synthase (NADPH/NADH) small chain|nr:glutamate synthase subunit beta [FCB group bacterium]